jgi:adenylate cyclase
LAVRKRSSSGRPGEPRPPPAAFRLQTQAEASASDRARSVVLDGVFRAVEGVATGLVHRSSRRGGALAARTIPSLLGAAFKQIGKNRAAFRQFSDSQFDSHVGAGQSLVACAPQTKNAIGYFQRSIERDPKYALAYAGLALAYAEWRPGMSRPQENMPKGREDALKALALDETQSMGHSVLGSIELYFDWNWAGAEKEFKRALELNPNDYLTHSRYARLLVAMGRTDEALTHVRTAMGLDPFWEGDYPIWVTYLARRYDEALELAKTKSALDPNNPWYHFDLALIHGQMGGSRESAEEYLKFETLSGTEPQSIARLRQAFDKSGPDGFWNRRLEEYREASKSQYVSNGMAAEACLRVGETECAVESLEKAFHERDDLMINLNVDPAFDGIRSDPRFQDLVRRVGLPEGKPQT